METHPQTVLVTGGAGYIGSVLVRLLLRNGLRVRVIDNLSFGGESLLGFLGDPCFDFIQGDIRKSTDLTAALKGVGSVVHLAAIVGDPACKLHPELAAATNKFGAELLLERAIAQGTQRFIFASTCSNYGKVSDMMMCSEDSRLNPISLYAELKVAFEQRLLSLNSDTLCTVCLRFATAYGLSPRPRFDLTVNEFARDLYLRKQLEVFGEQFWRPYCHVSDLAHACYLALVAPRGVVDRRAFNVGHSDENYRKIDLVAMILEELPDRASCVSYVMRTEDPRDYRVNCDRIQDTLGFIPLRRVKDGIQEILGALDQGMITNPENPRYRNL